MSRIQQFLDALAFARGYTVELLTAIPEADWFVMPPGCPSHVAWQVGHLAFAEARLIVERVGGRTEIGGGVLPVGYFELFGRNSVPEPDRAKHPSPAELRRALSEDEYLEAVHADMAHAHAYGIRGVPFFVVDDRYGVSGAHPPGVFNEVLYYRINIVSVDMGNV